MKKKKDSCVFKNGNYSRTITLQFFFFFSQLTTWNWIQLTVDQHLRLKCSSLGKAPDLRLLFCTTWLHTRFFFCGRGRGGGGEGVWGTDWELLASWIICGPLISSQSADKQKRDVRRGPTVYSPYQRRIELICRWSYKVSSSSSLKPLSACPESTSSIRWGVVCIVSENSSFGRRCWTRGLKINICQALANISQNLVSIHS